MEACKQSSNKYTEGSENDTNEARGTNISEEDNDVEEEKEEGELSTDDDEGEDARQEWLSQSPPTKRIRLVNGKFLQTHIWFCV